MNSKKCNLLIFSIGAIGYGLIEILWRGHTHWSMTLAGGLSFLGLSTISKRMRNNSLFSRALVGCIFITAMEYFFGIIFNVILRKNVWDYSKMPFNLGGQICALYSLFWLILSFLFIPLAGKINKKLSK